MPSSRAPSAFASASWRERLASCTPIWAALPPGAGSCECASMPAVAAGGLGGVHRVVGALQRAVDAGARRPGERDDADAGAHLAHAPGRRQRLLAQALPERPRHLLGLLLARARQQHGELVAGQASEVIGRAQALLHRARRVHQHAVADGVPERVVQLLEAIQVEHQQRAARVLAAARSEVVGQRRQERPAVRQTGQLVDLGEAMQLCLVVAAVGDVAKGEDHRLRSGIGRPSAWSSRTATAGRPSGWWMPIVRSRTGLPARRASPEGYASSGSGDAILAHAPRGRARAAYGRPAATPGAPGSPPRPGCRPGCARLCRARRPRPGGRRRSSASRGPRARTDLAAQPSDIHRQQPRRAVQIA